MSQPNRFQLWSACLGNLLEHFDTALFGVLSPFLAPLFFPEQDPLIQLLLTYAMIPLGMLARPLGALVFGQIGDRQGRERALFLSLTGMGIVSIGMGFCPIYSEAGLFAPLFLCIGRLLQNFLSAGETMGGAVYLLEYSSEKKHDLLSSLYNTTTVAGIILPSACVALLSFTGHLETHWRSLFIFGGVTALFGSMFRKPYQAVTKPVAKSSLWEHRYPLLLIALISGFSYANYTMALILPNGFIPLVTTFTKGEMMGLNTALLVFDFLTLPLFGWLSSKISRRKLMLGTAGVVTITAIPLLMLIENANFQTVVLIRTLFVLFGVAFCAPLHAWVQALVPPSSRYKVVSFGYAIGSQLLGGPTSFLSLYAFQATGMVSSVAWYWMALALVNLLVLIPHRKEVYVSS